MNTRERSLGYLLLEAGVDLWLGNNRGSRFSRGHVSLEATSAEYWDFSIDDFACFDVPCFIGKIVDVRDFLRRMINFFGLFFSILLYDSLS